MTPELVLRPLADATELPLFRSLPYVLDHELADDLATGRRRPEWMWVALRAGRVVARLAFWSQPGAVAPESFDFFDLDGADPDRVAAGTALLAAATAAVLPAGAARPDFIRFLPPDWRDEPATRQATEDLLGVLTAAGAELFVERLRLEWLPGTPVPEPSGRLEFTPVTDEAELVELMAWVLDGTLDAYSRADLESMTPAESAAAQFDEEFAHFRSPRDWWRIGRLPGGGPVGFVVPARNDYNPIIAYVGVLPEHRGRGYIADLLAEGTRILAGQDVPRIRAATDLGNVPMAAAFARAGYRTFERSVVLRWR
ncbi:GNAT family N-acetyltransferase [Longispora urticae]